MSNNVYNTPIARIINTNKKTIIITSFIVCAIAIIVLIVSLVCSISCKQENSDYTITYYYNKGIYFWNTSTSNEQHISVKYQDNTIYKVEKTSGDYISEPPPPTNEGYVFLGWYQNPECTDKFLFGYYEINSNINLYAKWGNGR